MIKYIFQSMLSAKQLLFIVFCCCVQISYSQLNPKVSGNNNFLVNPTFSFRKSEVTFNIYSVSKKALIRQIHHHAFIKSRIKDYKISYDAQFLAVSTDDSTYIYNVRQARVINVLSTYEKVYFLHHGKEYLVLYPNLGTLQQFQSGNEKPIYTYTVQDAENVLDVSSDYGDQFLFIKGNKERVYIYSIAKVKTPKSIIAQEFILNDVDSVVHSFIKIGGKFIVFNYNYPQFKRKRKVAPDKMIVKYIKDHQLNSESKTNLVYHEAQFSEGGKYLSIRTQLNKSKWMVFVYNVQDQKIVAHTELSNEISVDFVHQWSGDSSLVVSNSNMTVQYLSIKNDTAMATQLDVTFNTVNNDKTIKEEQQLKDRSFSNKTLFEILPVKKLFSKEVNVKSILRENDYNTFINTKMLTISNNGKYLFIEQNKSIGYVKLNDSLRLNSVSFFNLDLESLEPPDAEYALEDTAYKAIKKYIHIKDLQPDAQLTLVYKSVNIEDSLVRVQFQLMDNKGNYYYGGSQETYKELWCNLLLNTNKKEYQQLRTYKIRESLIFDTVPNTVALVGDYSGSMGKSKVTRLEVGMDTFIIHKFSADEMSIIKYDHKAKIEARKELNHKDLILARQNRDYSDFGGGTAMLDGISEAVDVIKSSKVKGVKVVIVLTDGYENSSMSTENEVIELAKKFNVQVFTIALGPNVNEKLMKNIALHTNGGYYKIMSSTSLLWIFDDIYRKVRSFYEVEFKTDTLGKHNIILKACHPQCNNCSGRLEVKFDNSLPKISLPNHDTHDENRFELFADESEEDEADSLLKMIPDLKDFSEVSPVQEIKANIKKEDEDILLNFEEIEQEFEKMALPHFNFLLDKDSIIGSYSNRVDTLLNFLNKYPEINLMISGHTDNQASALYNEKLSLLRAQKVKALLVSRGITTNRLWCEGRGETEPIASNDSEQGRAANRRIEFEIFEK